MKLFNMLTTTESKNTPVLERVEEVVDYQESSSKLSTVIGQKLAISLLEGAIHNQRGSSRIAPAYLFIGSDGVGKSLAARCFIAEAFGIHKITNHPDVLQVEPTYMLQGQLLKESELPDTGVQPKVKPQIRIEQVREITQFLSHSPLFAPKSVVIIEEAHQMTQAATNALLKTLEESKIATIILLSSQPQKLLPTITSRCQQVPFHKLSSTNMTVVLEKLGRQDILNNPTVMALAAGSPGQAIEHYKQLQLIPQSILDALLTPPTTALQAIQISKEIEVKLEFQQQLWLLDYLQQQWWNYLNSTDWVSKLELAKTAMLKLVSPRLVWDVMLLPVS